MSETMNYKPFGDLLRHYRKRTKPHQVGIVPAGLRRVPGLRREEVAELAGISADWYNRLEQGRSRCSADVLHKLADIFDLSAAEREHLLTVAGMIAASPQPETSPQFNAGLQRLLDQQRECPAYILNPRWDTLAWNQMAQAVFGYQQHSTLQQRNVLYLLFMNPEIEVYGSTVQRRRPRDLLRDWEYHMQEALRVFRMNVARYNDDPSLLQLVEFLCCHSPEFRQWWHQPEVVDMRHRHKVMHQHDVGLLAFTQLNLQVLPHADLCMVTYLPTDERTAQRLHCLYHAISSRPARNGHNQADWADAMSKAS